MLFICVSCGTAACMEEVDIGIPSDEADGVVFTIEDFISETGTKSAFETSTMKFQWSTSDVIGILPGEGWQTEFRMEAGAGSNTAVFDGGHWGLKTEGTYYAYYPFSNDNFESEDSREKVKYSYEGQETCSADKSGIVNLNKYDFMASGAGRLVGGTVNFNFRHLGALCRIRFKAPESASYSNIVIEADEAVFSMTGHYDATDKDGDGVISLVGSSEKISRFVVSFPENHQTFAAQEDVECYFLMPPSDLSGRNLTFRLQGTDASEYSAPIVPKNVEAGKSYCWDVELSSSANVCGLSGNGAANCYIVSEAGSYKFPAVQGNSGISVGDVTSVEVLWETFGTKEVPNAGDLVQEVSYSDGYIYFKATDRKGNASIAAKNKNGRILWSWHIWMTDKPKDQVYCNNAGTMMDRNLGATSAVPGDVGALGLMYQWGRKDPFPGSSYISSDITAESTVTWPLLLEFDSSNGTIDFTTSHPTIFIMYTHDTDNDDWYYTGSSSVDDTRWQSKKTVYDPCPAGYRIPDGGENGVWSAAFGTSFSFDENGFDTVNKGFNFGKSDTNKYLTEEPICWYPLAGLAYSEENEKYGSLVDVGSEGSYWSCSPYSIRAFGLELDNYGYVGPAYISHRVTGQSVRCFKEGSSMEVTEPPVSDLSKKGTANCYIVSSSGRYKFRTVQGNSSTPVGPVAAVEILWESFGTSEAPVAGDLVSEVSYSDGYITFRASYKEGNALIAVKDASGTILWSWHIWFTDRPEDKVCRNKAGTIMDRNLGATSIDYSGGYGIMYQWGRKDPFMGGAWASRNKAESTIVWPSAVESDALNGTVSYATAHPTTFIASNSGNGDWFYTGSSSTDNLRWQSSKTIYDPCPVGYRVPDGGDDGVWSKDMGNSSSLNFKYVFAGWLYGKDGSLSNLDSVGYYWSCSACDDRYAYSLAISDGSVDPSNFKNRAAGLSVRCFKE